MNVVLSLLTYALGALAISLAALCYYLNSNFDYWKKRGVPYLQPEPFFGNVREITLLKKSMADVLTGLYRHFEGKRFAGIFMSRTPSMLLIDPELVKNVLVKDFGHFQDRGHNFDEDKDPLSAHLFNLGGSKWRKLRTKMTPTFTSGKMKMMFHLMEECSSQLQMYLADVANASQGVELREVLAKFTTDVIGTCAFGLQLNSMSESESEFRKMGKKVFDPSVINDIRRFLGLLIPALAKVLRVRMVSEDTTAFFTQAVKDTVEYREKNNVKRNDFLQLLIQMKNGKIEQEYDPLINNNFFDTPQKNGFAMQNGSKLSNGHGTQNGKLRDDDDLELTDNLLAAQAFVFFLAGFETSATTMSFALHELAVNPDIQEKLREEVDATYEKCGGKLTYDAVQEMDYLDKVLSEALRKYPPGHVLVRQCTRDYAVPGSSVVLEKGLRVLVPVYAMHHDAKYYPEPERFDPERFSPEQKAQRPPFTYLPFGEGPRLCIGMRFGLLQAKVGLAALISRYQFHVCERTSIPLTIEPRTIVTSPKGGIWLRVSPRS
ncbi:hypothetical protein R5R35_002117 [Gryllus longicercus]|uniref:Cytochrome P450 n=1 Tax=Gryllus longicercus TaxID=2509291 RepID=A0AAN9VSH0_9ORTH